MCLKLLTPMLSFSCGRNFATGRDAQHRVWCILSWGRPFVFDHALFDATRPDTTVVQVKSWWAFDAHTASGSVRIWNPALDQMGAAWGTKQVELDQLPGGDAGALARGGEIQRYTWTHGRGRAPGATGAS